MKKNTAFIILALTSISLVGCSKKTIEPAYQKAERLPSFEQDSFDEYVTDTQQWLTSNRVFITDDQQFELEANSPREYKPAQPNGQAVLLVHGLSDSPYSFNDVATHLAEQGYLVRAVLLPGHGSKVGDLQLPTLSDWQGVVDHHTRLLQQEYDSVWLGGYSTGANLVTSQAINDPLHFKLDVVFSRISTCIIFREIRRSGKLYNDMGRPRTRRKTITL